MTLVLILQLELQKIYRTSLSGSKLQTTAPIFFERFEVRRAALVLPFAVVNSLQFLIYIFDLRIFIKTIPEVVQDIVFEVYLYLQVIIPQS